MITGSPDPQELKKYFAALRLAQRHDARTRYRSLKE